MENLLLIVLVFVSVMFAILAFVIVRDERDKEESERNTSVHPQISYRGIHLEGAYK